MAAWARTSLRSLFLGYSNTGKAITPDRLPFQDRICSFYLSSPMNLWVDSSANELNDIPGNILARKPLDVGGRYLHRQQDQFPPPPI